MEFIEGLPIMDAQKLLQEGFNRKQIASTISTAFSLMIFESGFVHSDPHQGNFLVRKYKKNCSQVVLLDHGLYRSLSSQVRLSYSKLWHGIIR